MIVYVKICPVCGTENDETRTVCGRNGCNHYIEAVEPVPRQFSKPPGPEPFEATNPPEATSSDETLNTREVKICPSCKAQNPKDFLLCSTQGCNTNIAFVEETIVPIPHPKSFGTMEPRIYLEHSELAGPIEVRSGQDVGQAHPTSNAQVQLSGIPNIQFISRSHCRFELTSDQWFVTAIATATNVTYVNEKPVVKGTRVPIRNGDVVTMANVSFRVRIMS